MLQLLRKPSVLAGLFIAFFLTAPAGAAPVLDQSQLNREGTIGFFSNTEFGQTFEAGMSGMLSRIDLSLAEQGGGDLIFTLYTADGGTPGGSLFQTTILREDFTSSGLTGIDLSAEGIAVTAGDMFAIGLTAANDLPVVADQYSNETDPYQEGELWIRNLSQVGSIWSRVPGFGEYSDLTFATYVDGVQDPEPVPEPGLLVLMLAGLGCILLAGRRSRA